MPMERNNRVVPTTSQEMLTRKEENEEKGAAYAEKLEEDKNLSGFLLRRFQQMVAISLELLKLLERIESALSRIIRAKLPSRSCPALNHSTYLGDSMIFRVESFVQTRHVEAVRLLISQHVWAIPSTSQSKRLDSSND
jgi:hypothetical protein